MVGDPTVGTSGKDDRVMSGEPVRVLFVEDAATDARFVEGLLTACVRPRYEVTVVGSLAAAREHLEKHTPDVIIADLGLPDSTGLDTVTAISASASALANVGPGLGEMIGPAGNYSKLPDSAKWVLSAGMLLGRLELFTVLVLFSPNFWRT